MLLPYREKLLLYVVTLNLVCLNQLWMLFISLRIGALRATIMRVHWYGIVTLQIKIRTGLTCDKHYL